MSFRDIGWETGPGPSINDDHRGPRVVGGPLTRRRRLGLHLLVVAIFASMVVGLGATPSLAHDPGYPRVEILGGGWGHGRGMGQYGALGYARDHGWTSRRILDHFYGGTTQGPAPSTGTLDPGRLRVQLASMNNHATAMTLSLGRMVVIDSGGSRVRTVSEPALRFLPASSGFTLQVAEGCRGPWTDLATIGGSSLGVKVELDPNDPADDGETIGRDSQTLLGVCGPVRAWYDGEIWTHRTSYGQRTVNIVTVEQYLRGVVPNEVPASWPEAVLEAQAVAARSYALAGDGRWGSHADTCDNTYCQVYDGRVTTRGGVRIATHSRTDAAIAATRNQVRLTSSGRVARTEFSSSTGGHTAGGDFSAVEDLGDATSANPNSRWAVTVGLGGLANRYGLGPVTSIAVTRRDGHGRFGGRAQEVTIRFRDGTRTMTGSAVRRYFGLKSELYDFGPIQTASAPAPEADPTPDPAPDVREAMSPAPIPEPDLGTQRAIVKAMFRRLADRSPSADELTTWSQALATDEADGRRHLARELVSGEAFAGKLVDDLYRSTFDRAADPQGRDYWVGRLTSSGRSGLSYEEIGTYFFGSTEYYRRSGGSHAGFVGSLYNDLLGREADREGLDYWLGVLRRRSTADTVTWFYRSEESRRDRAATLHVLATGRRPSQDRIADGAELLNRLSDLELAARYGAGITP